MIKHVWGLGFVGNLVLWTVLSCGSSNTHSCDQQVNDCLAHCDPNLNEKNKEMNYGMAEPRDTMTTCEKRCMNCGKGPAKISAGQGATPTGAAQTVEPGAIDMPKIQIPDAGASD